MSTTDYSVWALALAASICAGRGDGRAAFTACFLGLVLWFVRRDE